MSYSPPADLYPELSVERIQSPNRFWAVPLLGFLVKAVILIPVLLWSGLLGIALLGGAIICSFVVLLSGHYWAPMYHLFIGYWRLYTKAMFFLAGLSDHYPGFGFAISDPAVQLEMPMPDDPNKLFAFPLVGGVIRIILIIPYALYAQVISYGSVIGVIFASFWVLFSGRYPEAVFELVRDATRVWLAAQAWSFGISDDYPSFWISMNHKVLKVVLICLGALWFLQDSFERVSERMSR